MTRDGSLRSIWGERSLVSPLALKPLYHFSWIDFSQTQWVIISDGINVHAYALGGQDLDITPASGAWSGQFVSATVLNGVFVINSASNGLFYWPDTAGPLVEAPGWDSTWRCKSIASYRYNLFALGMTENNTEYPHKIRWSDSAEDGAMPAIWVPAASNDAGDDILGETGGVVVGGVLVGNILMVIKENAVYSVTWIGGDYIYQTRRLAGDIGTRNPRGFCEMRGSLVVLTSSDLRLFDGRQSRSLVDNRVRRQMFLGVSEEFWELTQVFYHAPSSSLIIAGAGAGSIGQLTDAFIYNSEENTFNHKHLGFSYGFNEALTSLNIGSLVWDDMGDSDHVVCDFDPVTLEETNCVGGTVGMSGARSGRALPNEVWDNQQNQLWNKGLRQPSTPDIVYFEANDDDTVWTMSVVGVTDTNSDGSAKTCMARRTGIPIEGASGMAQINGCWVELQGKLEDANGNNLPVRMRFGGQETVDSPVVWTQQVFEVYPGQNTFVDPIIIGRFMAWEIESFGIGQWHLGAITLEWEHAGAY
jgi:hypothetical protein